MPRSVSMFVWLLVFESIWFMNRDCNSLSPVVDYNQTVCFGIRRRTLSLLVVFYFEITKLLLKSATKANNSATTSVINNTNNNKVITIVNRNIVLSITVIGEGQIVHIFTGTHCTGI